MMDTRFDIGVWALVCALTGVARASLSDLHNLLACCKGSGVDSRNSQSARGKQAQPIMVMMH